MINIMMIKGIGRKWEERERGREGGEGEEKEGGRERESE